MPVRDATPVDLPVIRELLVDHAASEANVTIDAERDELAGALFGARPVVRATLAETAGPAREVTGLALWYPTFSSWTLRTGIWLEDLFVREAHRGGGVGRELMADLRARTGGRVEWEVAVDNGRAERFYRRLGAGPVSGWTRYRWLPPTSGSAGSAGSTGSTGESGVG
ncbi:GNAT family N-acetyltransferase [Pseudonocardia acaciae]|uniref:GNAT family N-acetyltransferase n=1 Tax=Pseudonocardia acaciae TaxID=551276 RepID=UPI000688A5B8|nr:GNAT family N-acetyltransferase [Pseudonocardia acaciae]